jgi:rod shape determining protein RodA
MFDKFDWKIFITIILISAFGLINLLGIDQEIFKDQFINFMAGLVAMVFAYKFGLNFFRLNNKLFYWSIFVTLVFVYIFGENIRGSKRWIDLYFFSYQPSEFLKLFYIIYVAAFLTNMRDQYDRCCLNFKTFIFSLFLFGLPIIIILKQPDLGSSLVYMGIYAGLLFMSGASIKYFINGFLLVFISSPIIWHFLKDYQKNRILSFINPNVDPSGIAYNSIQSIITIGSGGFFGKGLGFGTQSRLSFLPENHTDFVYASFIEQFGFLGGIILSLLFAYLIYRLTVKALQYRSSDTFTYLFIMGVVLLFLTQFFINTGMNLGILPVTGIPLPLISYGGSSVVSIYMIIGLVLGL